MVCLVSTEVGEGRFPLAYAEETKGSVPLLIFLEVMLQPELHSKFRDTIHFIFTSNLQQEEKGGLAKPAVIGQRVREGD